eukprot:5884924-Amphidinium_carterae.2
MVAGLIVLHRAPLRVHLLWSLGGRMQLLALHMGHVTSLVLHVLGTQWIWQPHRRSYSKAWQK